MSFISLNDIYYKHEGFGTLMGHYSIMYSIYLDTGIIPIIPINEQKFQPDTAMEFFNQFPNAFDHSDAFINFNQVFKKMKRIDYDNIEWQTANFGNASYNTIINFIQKNPLYNINCYWNMNSKLFWNHIDKIINHLFIFDKKIVDECNKLLPKSEKNIVAICVRNQYKKFTCPHIKLTMKYYIDAIKYFDTTSTKFLIFSDYIEESKELFSFLHNDHDIEYTSEMPSAQGMCLMSMCDGIINANSSFCYWASLLNKQPTKKIICPTKFIDPKADMALANRINYKWYPEDWIAIEST